MSAVTKRELNQHTAQVLASVAEGGPIVVTERGRARWRIEALAAEPDPASRLMASGQIRPPRADPVAWPADDAPADPARVDRVYAEARGDH